MTKTISVLGITDKVYKRSKRYVGHCFFFEIDNKGDLDLNWLVDIAIEYGCQIYVLETKAGFHFISFKIFSCGQYLKLWSEFATKYPKSDYNHNIANKILRISTKGNSPLPRYITDVGTCNEFYSRSHFDAYKKAGILHNLPKGKSIKGIPMKTKCKVVVYASSKRIR